MDATSRNVGVASVDEASELDEFSFPFFEHPNARFDRRISRSEIPLRDLPFDDGIGLRARAVGFSHVVTLHCLC